MDKAIRSHSGVTWADPPPFTNAKAAVRFALLLEGRPTAWRWNARTAGGGLGGTDAAVQAGFVLGALGQLSELERALLGVSTLPHRKRCECRAPCCRGSRPNAEWQRAAAAVCVGVRKALSVKTHDGVLMALLARIYGNTTTLPRIAEICGEALEVVGRQNRALVQWLAGDRKTFAGTEALAWRAAEEVLRERGIVGEA